MSSFRKNSKRTAPGTAVTDRDSRSLIISCAGCEQLPDPSNGVCARCICEAIAEEGPSERIRLAGTRDTEISGSAAQLLCELATLSIPVMGDMQGRRCRGCSRSPSNVLCGAWADFPEPALGPAMSRLYSDPGDGPECTVCMQKTYAALKKADDDLSRIRAKASSMARNGGAF